MHLLKCANASADNESAWRGQVEQMFALKDNNSGSCTALQNAAISPDQLESPGMRRPSQVVTHAATGNDLEWTTKLQVEGMEQAQLICALMAKGAVMDMSLMAKGAGMDMSLMAKGAGMDMSLMAKGEGVDMSWKPSTWLDTHS